MRKLLVLGARDNKLTIHASEQIDSESTVTFDR